MEFTFETKYDMNAMTAMAKGLRKTVRKEQSRRSHIYGAVVVIIALALTLPPFQEKAVLDFSNIVTWLAALVIILVRIFEDRLNAYIAKKRMIGETNKAESVFNDEFYITVSKMGKTEWDYKNIKAIAQNKNYFVLLFDKNHAQVYDKSTVSGGTSEEFGKFISEKTKLNIVSFK